MTQGRVVGFRPRTFSHEVQNPVDCLFLAPVGSKISFASIPNSYILKLAIEFVDIGIKRRFNFGW